MGPGVAADVPEPAEAVENSGTGGNDDLAPARGVALGAVIGAVIWSGIMMLLLHIMPARL